jgi:hypothetical protein
VSALAYSRPPVMDSAPEWVEGLMSRVSATEACAVVQHLFGVVPLIDAFFQQEHDEMAAITAGVTRGVLGLFTSTATHRWGAAALRAESFRGAIRLSGEVSLPSQDADGSIVLVSLNETEHRLVWLHHHRPGVAQRGSWLVADGATISSACLSRPVRLDHDADLFRCLAVYASVWALLAVSHARREVRTLRCAVRTARGPGAPEAFSTSQLVAMGIAEVEIETELATVAARQHFALDAPPAASAACLALAVSAARTLAAVSAKSRDLRDQLGLTLDADRCDAAATTLMAAVGGTFMLEQELARVVCDASTSLGSP